MLNDERLIVDALNGHARVNVDTKSVEVYDEYGVKLVLRNLSDATFEAFKRNFPNF